tara:strand:- start:81206 stop:81775 length:570 start_codon:yes stop_codon:yes gene_type:complete
MTRIINSNHPKVIEIACEELSSGNVIVYPTETIYGFGCDATNGSAINKINNIKDRIAPLSVLAPNKGVTKKWINLDLKEKKEISKKLGGRMTVIAPAIKSNFHPSVLGPGDTIGIRIPDHILCNKLSKRFGKPITTTSVNISGNPPMVNPDQIYKHFKNKIGLIIDEGIINGYGSKIYVYEKGKFRKIR